MPQNLQSIVHALVYHLLNQLLIQREFLIQGIQSLLRDDYVSEFDLRVRKLKLQVVVHSLIEVFDLMVPEEVRDCIPSLLPLLQLAAALIHIYHIQHYLVIRIH